MVFFYVLLIAVGLNLLLFIGLGLLGQKSCTKEINDEEEKKENF
jgi:hypothetical protein